MATTLLAKCCPYAGVRGSAAAAGVTITLLCENNWTERRFLRSEISITSVTQRSAATCPRHAPATWHAATRAPSCSTRCSRSRPRSPGRCGRTGPACTCHSAAAAAAVVVVVVAWLPTPPSSGPGSASRTRRPPWPAARPRPRAAARRWRPSRGRLGAPSSTAAPSRYLQI